MVYVILPVFNRVEQTKKFIEDLLAQTNQEFHLILVDDGSTDGTGDFIRSTLPAKSSILTGKGSWWWGGSLHQAYLFLSKKIADTGDYVLIMNNDTRFDREFIETGLNIIGPQTNVLLTANAYNLVSQNVVDVGVTIDWEKFEFRASKFAGEINCLSTRGLLMYLSTFQKLGGFYPLLLPHYLSDYEYTYRAFRKGYKLMTDNSFKLLADESTTGINVVDNDSAVEFKDLFSKRYKANPLYRISFITLAGGNLFKNIKFIYRELYTMYRSLLGITLIKIRSKRNE